jgi:hypothetical protein
MSEVDAKNYRELLKRLLTVRIAWRMNAAAQGLLVALIAAGAPVAAGLLFGTTGRARLVFLVLAAASGGAALVAGVLRPILRPLSALDAAFLAERKFPRLEGRAAAAVEVWKETENSGSGFDRDYISELLEEAAAAFRSARVSHALNLRRTAGFAVAFAVFAALFTAVMSLAGIGPGRLAVYVAPPYLPKQENFRLEWITGDITVQVGGAAKIEARFSGNILGVPVLIVEREGIEPAELQFERLRSNGFHPLGFRAEIPSVAGDTTYRISYKRFMSRPYIILAVEPPRVRSMTVRLVYPRHTGIMPDERTGGGDLRVPYGTRASFRMESTSSLRSAYLKLAGGGSRSRIPLSISGATSAVGTLTVRKNTRYTIHLADNYGFENRFPPEYFIESISDGMPDISILKPGNDLNLPRDSALPIKGEARDDYGVARININARIVGSGNLITIPVVIQPAREILFEFTWNISALDAAEGDTIEFYLSATDNDALTGPKTSVSQTRRVRLLSQFEDYKEIQKDQDNLLDRMQTVVSEGEQLTNDFKNLAQNPGKNDRERRQWRSEAQRSMDRWQELQRELNGVTQSMKDSLQRMQDNNLVNLETIEKLRELNQIMQSVMTDEVRALMDQIRKQLENVDVKGADRKMIEAMWDQQKINQSLEQSIQRFKRIRAEQQLSALRQQLKELAERQARLHDNTKELDRSTVGKEPSGPQRQRANRQSREEGRVLDETESALATAKQLAGDIRDTSPQTAEKLEQTVQTAEKDSLPGELSSARDSLGQCDLGPAGRHEKNALETMQRMSGELDTMQQQFNAEMTAKTLDMIRTTLRKTLDISEAHEDVVRRTRQLLERNALITTEEYKPIAYDEQVAREAALALSEDAARLTAFSMAAPAHVPVLAADAALSLSSAIDYFSEGDYSRALSEQKNASLRLNQLALALMDAEKRASTPSQMSEWESYLQQLQQLAQSQQNLNDATKNLSNSGLPMPQLTQGLQSLAVQQQLIQQGMQQLAGQMERFGQSADQLGQIGSEMDEIKRELAGGNADLQVQRRQSNVLRRMQDATLSLRKESIDEHRTAETAKDYTPSAPPRARDLVRDSIPEPIRKEMDRLRSEPAPKGYDSLIDGYYRELLRGE